MALRGIKDTEKVAVGAIRTAIQTWLAPQLSDISERLTHVEARLDGFDRRFEAVEKQIQGFEWSTQEILKSLRNEMEARFDTVRADFKRLDIVAELRERIASLEAKLVQQN